MAGDDRRARPTRPPANPLSIPMTHEDSPPMQRGPVPPRVLTESIAKIAARAPLAANFSQHEELLRAIAQVSMGQEDFEHKIRQEVKELLVERQPLPPPPHLPSINTPLPEQKKKFSLAPKSLRDMSWIGHVPAILMAVAAIITTTAQSCVKKQSLDDDAKAMINNIDSKLDAHVKAHDLDAVKASDRKKLDYKYEVDQRNWLAPVLEKLSVKIDDPEGAPPRTDIDFYPPPAQRSKAPRIQPKATFPAPPRPE